MALRIRSDSTTDGVKSNLEKARRKYSDSLQKLSSGVIFTKQNPRAAERAISERMGQSVASLQMGKNNASMAISLVQTGESGLNEISNILIRMKELSMQAMNNTVSDKERSFFLTEYESLRNEIDRIANNTEFNGIKIIKGGGDDFKQENLSFFVGALNEYTRRVEDNPNVVQLEGIDKIKATTENLMIRSSKHLLQDEEGIPIEDLLELIEPEENDYATVFDEALHKISSYRATFGGMSARLERVVDFIDVHEENIRAAKSNIDDVDVAKEVANMAKASILVNTSSSLLSQVNMERTTALRLIQNL